MMKKSIFVGAWLHGANVEFMPPNSGPSLPNHHTISCICALSHFQTVSFEFRGFLLSIQPETHSPLTPHTLCSLNLVNGSVAMSLSVHCWAPLCGPAPLPCSSSTINFSRSNKKFNFNYACTDHTHYIGTDQQARWYQRSAASGTCLSLQQIHKHFIL